MASESVIKQHADKVKADLARLNRTVEADLARIKRKVDKEAVIAVSRILEAIHNAGKPKQS